MGLHGSRLGRLLELGILLKRIFLPWLLLSSWVIFEHARENIDLIWTGLGLATGALALFATLVTRAGGVWAASVHTFVV